MNTPSTPQLPTFSRRLLGPYAMTPGPNAGATPGASESDFYSGLATASIDLIEFPLLAEGAYSLDPAWIEAHLAPEWDLMITAIPRTMARLGDMATYGLASTDEGGRAAALADIAHARDLAQDLAQRSGRSRVVAIELHSAPGPHLGSLEALEPTLGERGSRSTGDVQRSRVADAKQRPHTSRRHVRPGSCGRSSSREQRAPIRRGARHGATGTSPRPAPTGRSRRRRTPCSTTPRCERLSRQPDRTWPTWARRSRSARSTLTFQPGSPSHRRRSA